MEPTIYTVTATDDVQPVRALFREYSVSLDFDLCFQDFEQELTDLPGPYAPPSGCLLLAVVAGEAAGCVALKGLTNGVCEMKRLYVRRQHRGVGLGRLLVGRIIQEARNLGYQVMRLDTIPSVMERAIAMYRSFGFHEIPPYCYNPIPRALFMELRM
jgi:GNAT superfamily N-acetyltransferase